MQTFIFPVSSSSASVLNVCISALLFQLPPHLKLCHMKAFSVCSCCHIPCHPLSRDKLFFSLSRHNTTNPLPSAATAKLTFCQGPDWNLTFELHLRTGSFGSLLSSGVETAVPLPDLHHPQQLFMLLVPFRARCSFWLLSSFWGVFFAIPAPPLHPPPPLSVGNYSFQLPLTSIKRLLIGWSLQQFLNIDS